RSSAARRGAPDSWVQSPSLGRLAAMSSPAASAESYSYLGPVGTFTWLALTQVPEAAGAEWRSVNNVGEALDDVLSGRSVAAMIAIENSVEGGVSATQDALANLPGLRIRGRRPGARRGAHARGPRPPCRRTRLV